MALERLQFLVADQVLDLPEELSTYAWRIVFDNPQLVVEVAVPDDATLTHEGIIPRGARGDLYRVMLCVVLRPLQESIADGYVSDARIAGVVHITYETAPGRPSQVEDAWFSATWHESTASLGLALESVGHSASWSKPVNRGVVLLWGDDLPVDAEDVQLTAGAAAALAGLQLEVHKVTPANERNVLGNVRSAWPSWMFLVNPSEPMQKLGEEFGLLGSRARYGRTLFTSSESLYVNVRDRLLAFVGVDGALRALTAPPELTDLHKPESTGIGFIPTECLHEPGSRHVYVTAEGQEYWWTKDTANHAGAVYKKYKRSDMILTHVVDVDSTGAEMEGKTKGETGQYVRIANMHRCGHPHTHV
ncbi:hypothetical protein ACMA46_01700 [Clavibacter sp. Sh2141]|uniref:hypothetical protein n=1 Tax=Clavibacter sp. Sh2141 TaxID=3395374 RepID=UPI0039BC4A0E